MSVVHIEHVRYKAVSLMRPNAGRNMEGMVRVRLTPPPATTYPLLSDMASEVSLLK